MNKYLSLILLLLVSCTYTKDKNKIDRFDLVSRHNAVNNVIDPLNSLTVGNGEFAFTADVTGMQTFPEYYEEGISLGTQSQWGWHSFPNNEKYNLTDVIKKFKSGPDSIPYVFQFSENDSESKFKASEWLRENPHRLHLGLIGIEITEDDSSANSLSDISVQKQVLNLWSGELESSFLFKGVPVKVITVCHQRLDMVSFKISSDLIEQGKLKIKIRFPYPSHDKFNSGYSDCDKGKHSTTINNLTEEMVVFKRQLDDDIYYSQFEWKGSVTVKEFENHIYKITPEPGNNTFEICCHFSKEESDEKLPSFSETLNNSKVNWKKFWMSGAAVDFSECSDPRAFELERRVVLSQYLTRVQCCGSLPPQETGLTCNSWYGKFHLEMHWWHAVHFILWGRADLVEKQIDYYFTIRDKAKITAQTQGYEGVRWPKMTDPQGNESPSTIGTLLIWQQPHLIYFTDLLYRYYGNDKNLLIKYHYLEESTADFMASYARFEPEKNRYILGPAVIPAQECFNPETTINPVFELSYWNWALTTAQNHRMVLGLERNEKWQNVIDHLSTLPVKDSLYLFTEDATDSYNNPRYLADHPIVLGTGGFLPPSDMVDKKILENSFNSVIDKWNWDTCWGWDFPMAAMCAAVLGKPYKAVDLLLMDTPKNKYLLNGHNYQNENLKLYLPGNGALLTAVAFMCENDGFPEEWNLKKENFFNLISQ